MLSMFRTGRKRGANTGCRGSSRWDSGGGLLRSDLESMTYCLSPKAARIPVLVPHIAQRKEPTRVSEPDLVVKTLGVALRVKVDEVARASAEVRVLLLKSLGTSVRAQMSAEQGIPLEPLQYRSLRLCSKSCRRRGSAVWWLLCFWPPFSRWLGRR
jgi:hypothetical protein